jgi:rubrerythrin
MDNLNYLISLIAKNAAGEHEAIEGYFQLLAYQGFPKEFYDDVREIISDEMNHSQKLEKWVVALSKIHPAKD